MSCILKNYWSFIRLTLWRIESMTPTIVLTFQWPNWWSWPCLWCWSRRHSMKNFFFLSKCSYKCDEYRKSVALTELTPPSKINNSHGGHSHSQIIVIGYSIYNLNFWISNDHQQSSVLVPVIFATWFGKAMFDLRENIYLILNLDRLPKWAWMNFRRL